MKKVFKLTGITLGILAGLIALALVTVFFIAESKISQTYEVAEASEFTAVSDSAALAHGAHLSMTLGCQSCHAADFSGQVMIDAPPFQVVASNLTAGAGGVGGAFTDTDFERAIRHGIRPNGTGLFMMPSESYNNLSDADLSALVAYLRSTPPVDNELPRTEMRMIGRAIMVTGGIGVVPEAIDHSQAHAASVPAGATKEYGQYLSSLTCIHCHGADLRGGKHPDPEGPLGPDLHVVSGWTLDQFKTAMRTGQAPNRALDPHWMPWEEFKYMSDTELEALYQHLTTLPPRTQDA